MKAWCSDWWPAVAAVAEAQYLTPDGKDVLEYSDKILHKPRTLVLDVCIKWNSGLKDRL